MIDGAQLPKGKTLNPIIPYFLAFLNSLCCLLYRVEFEASVDHISEEEVPSIMDEDEWTDRNCLQHESSKIKDGEPDDPVDTSEDSFSDLNSDTSDEDDDEDDDEGERSTRIKKSGPESRPLTADETRLLQKEWIKKCDLLESGTKKKRPEVDRYV